MSERQVEIPALIEFVSLNLPKVLLDVGCAETQYSGRIQPFIGPGGYKGIDLKFWQDIYLDTIIQDDFLNPSYLPVGIDSIISVSVIEHTKNPTEFMRKIVNLATKSFFVSFPFGDMPEFTDNFQAINKELLESWLDFLPVCVKANFYFSYHPNELNKSRWFEVPYNYAAKTKYNNKIGVQSVCILKGLK